MLRIRHIGFFVTIFFIFFTKFAFGQDALPHSSIIINEFMPAPASGSEWVELFNPTLESIDLSGWQVDDIEGGSAPVTIAPGTVILAEGYVVVEVGSRLNNTGDMVRLLDPTGVIVDEFEFPATQSGMVWARDEEREWVLYSIATPGEENQFDPEPTPILTISPTPTSNTESTITLTLPKTAHAGTPLAVKLSAKYLDPHTTYSVKFLAGASGSGQTNAVRTLGQDSATWLSWNAAWGSFPTFTTNASGSAEVTIQARVNEHEDQGDYEIFARIRKVAGTKNIDSTTKSIKVLSPQPTPQSSVKSASTNTQSSESQSIFIADAEQLANGVAVVVEGVVTAPYNVLGSGLLYVQDASGGIKVIVKTDQGDPLTIGARVRVTGTMGEAYKERYIKVNTINDIEVIGYEEPPSPLEVPTGELGEEHEGQLVFINGQVVSTSGNVFYIDDGSGPVKVYIRPDTNIQKPRMRKGMYSAIFGILSQYLDDYRILPRRQEDVIVSDTPIDSAQVLGAVTQLPMTGVGHATKPLIGITLIVFGLGMKVALVLVEQRSRMVSSRT